MAEFEELKEQKDKEASEHEQVVKQLEEQLEEKQKQYQDLTTSLDLTKV